MNKKYLIAGLLILTLIIAGIYIMYDSSVQKSDPWMAIPANAGIIIEIDHPHEFIEKLNNNDIWESIRTNKHSANIHKALADIDTIRSALFATTENDHKLVISLHPAENGAQINVLLIAEANDETGISKLKTILEGRQDYQVSQTDQSNMKIVIGQKRSLYGAYRSNLLIFSNNEKLLSSSIKNLKEGATGYKNDKALNILKSSSGKNVDARSYIKYQYFSAILKSYSLAEYAQSIDWLSEFSSWTETDIILKKEEVLLTGFTVQDNNQPTFLSFFQNQEAIAHKVFNILPYNTNMLLCLGRETFAGYPSNSLTELLGKQLDLRTEDIYDLISGEIVLAGNGPGDANKWFCMQGSQQKELKAYLDKIAKKTGSAAVENYANYNISRINEKAFIAGLFGKAFSSIQQNYYTFIGDFAVFANSRESLINLIRMYETGKTLDLNENFKVFADNLGEASNVLFYLKPYELKNMGASYVNKETAGILNENKSLIRSLHGLSFQFNGGDERYYTSIYLKGSKSNKEENLAVWKLNLDDIIIGKPALVKDHMTDNYNMVVFDQSKNMYLISTDGQIIWKKRIDALPESDIFEVDFYKNGKIQYLFNTRDFTYLIDKNGENVADYPRKLNPSATNGLNLFDYNNKRDYRMIVALSDKRVYNYKLDGKEVQGWGKPKTNDLVIAPIQRLVANNKDYIIINDARNSLSIVNRRGNRRIKLNQYPEKAKYSTFYINKTNSKGIILSTDVDGKLFYISESGNINYTDFGQYSASHFFLYEDFNGDGSVDFIYVDGADLKVFDRFKNVLFSYQFDSPISIKPEFFKLRGNERVLGIVADIEKTIYLFDKKGNPIISKGLVGETPFTVGNLGNNRDVNLITAAGSTLFNYRID